MPSLIVPKSAVAESQFGPRSSPSKSEVQGSSASSVSGRSVVSADRTEAEAWRLCAESLRGLQAAPPTPRFAQAAPRSPTSSLDFVAVPSFAEVPAAEPAFDVDDDKSVRSSGAGSDGEGLTQAQVEADTRKMTPHEKCSYWITKISIPVALSRGIDHRLTRQANNLLTKHNKSTDPSLKSALAGLSSHLKLVSHAEKLSPGVVCNLSDALICEYGKELHTFGYSMPPAVQKGLVARRVHVLKENGCFGEQFFNTVAAWSTTSGDAAEGLFFDHNKPTLYSLDVPDGEKAELFASYMLYGFIGTFIEKGRSLSEEFCKQCEKFLALTTTSTADHEIAEEVTEFMFDLVVALRALISVMDLRGFMKTVSVSALESPLKLQ